ncbi:MAG: D-alanine--D-alanine ligase [Elusimicrobiota bacterium]
MEIKKYLKNKTVGVLYGGTSAERDVSLKSGEAIIKALKKEKIKVIPVDVKSNFLSILSKIKIDVAFIALHGPFGEDGVIQAVLESAGIPYTGSGVLASALAMNKLFAKEIFTYHKIPSPDWIGINKNYTGVRGLKFPLVVKPSSQGSTIGVSIVRNRSSLFAGIKKALKYGNEVIVEKYIPGREITVGVLGNANSAKALPVVEIIPVSSDYYDFRAKYAPGGSRHIIPAQLSMEVKNKVQELAQRAFCALGCRAVARVDFRLTDSGSPYVIEVNTIPGMTETSLLPEAAQKAGMSFSELVLKIMEYSFLNSPL